MLNLDFAHHNASHYVEVNLLGTLNDASTSDVLLGGAMVVYAIPDGGGDARDEISGAALTSPSSRRPGTGNWS